MLPKHFIDIVVSDIVPRPSDAYEHTLKKLYMLQKLVVFASAFVTGLIILGMLITMKMDAWIWGFVAVFVLMNIIFVAVSYWHIKRTVQDKIAIFQQGKIVTGRITDHRKEINIAHPNSAVNSNTRGYQIVIALDHSDEEVVLGNRVRAIQHNAPEGSEVVGLCHDGQYLFGESDGMKFVH